MPPSFFLFATCFFFLLDTYSLDRFYNSVTIHVAYMITLFFVNPLWNLLYSYLLLFFIFDMVSYCFIYYWPQNFHFTCFQRTFYFTYAVVWLLLVNAVTDYWYMVKLIWYWSDIWFVYSYFNNLLLMSVLPSCFS